MSLCVEKDDKKGVGKKNVFKKIFFNNLKKERKKKFGQPIKI
jgi:hypothetical protein